MPDEHATHSSEPRRQTGRARRLLTAARRPLQRFLRLQAAGGIVLFVAAAVALLWANSAWSSGYTGLWHTPVTLQLGPWRFARDLQWWVNDCAMVIFFFLVGLEIRVEVHAGALSEWRRAVLPLAAALGGMFVPALVYRALAPAGDAQAGWGVPMATDIAFALGALALLGARVPPALRALLLALAVIDDLGAIVVIAVFYSSGIAWTGLLVAAFGLALVLLLRAGGVRAKLAYLPAGVVVWAGVYAAGVHPTIAGVLLGVLTPVRALPGGERCSPAESLIAALHPWVAFCIMPLFALANAGVRLTGMAFDPVSGRVALAAALGLLLGKPLGVLSASLLVVRSKLASLPPGLGVRHLVLLGMVAGIGFTMSLFIAQLAFGDGALLGVAKLGVLLASVAAALLGVAFGRLSSTTWATGSREPTEDDRARRSAL